MLKPVKIKYSCISKILLNSYKKFLKLNFTKFNFAYYIINCPIKIKKKTFLKSPHVNKKAKENFKFTLYSFNLYTTINFKYIKILKTNIPKNINILITLQI